MNMTVCRYARYTLEEHSKGFWQHGLVRRILDDVRGGSLGIEAAAWQLAVTPEMVWSAMGTSQKVVASHALLGLNCTSCRWAET